MGRFGSRRMGRGHSQVCVIANNYSILVLIPFPGAGRFFLANNTQNERQHTKPQVGGGESFTLDGGNDGGYFGKLAATTGGDLLTTAADVCWLHIGGYTPANCSTQVDKRWPGGKTGHALVILEGPGKGQWRRVVAVGGERSRAITVDAPFDPQPVANKSVIQVPRLKL
jgi:hypothetical protein